MHWECQDCGEKYYKSRGACPDCGSGKIISKHKGKEDEEAGRFQLTVPRLVVILLLLAVFLAGVFYGVFILTP